MEMLAYQTIFFNICMTKVKAKHKTKHQQPPLLLLPGHNFREDSVQVSAKKSIALRTPIAR